MANWQFAEVQKQFYGGMTKNGAIATAYSSQGRKA